jgi:hypothetical protein
MSELEAARRLAFLLTTKSHLSTKRPKYNTLLPAAVTRTPRPSAMARSRGAKEAQGTAWRVERKRQKVQADADRVEAALTFDALRPESLEPRRKRLSRLLQRKTNEAVRDDIQLSEKGESRRCPQLSGCSSDWRISNKTPPEKPFTIY